MSWGELTRLGVTLRPFENPPKAGKIPSPFDAPLTATLHVLQRELKMLNARQIVLQVGYREQDLRLDGMPRATARMIHDGVALSFESKWGPLRYETNEFTQRYYSSGEGWQQNLRAIALGMESLRKVDRYGVSKRGEQYTGWRAIPMSTDAADSLTSATQAREYLQEKWSGDITAAIKATHPDAGGDSDEFRRVMKAKELIGTAS